MSDIKPKKKTRSPRKGAAPKAKPSEKSPVAIITEPLGEPVVDPRPWQAPDAVQPPEDLEENISRIVAAALARALPAALATPAITQGCAATAPVPSVTSQRPEGVASPSGLTAAVGRPPRPIPVSRQSTSTSVPQDGHATTAMPPKRSVTTLSNRPRLHLPPPPTRVTEPLVDDSGDRQLITFSPEQFLGDEDLGEMEQEPHPFAAMPGLENCPLLGLRSALSRPSGVATPTSRQTALWTQSRGGGGGGGPNCVMYVRTGLMVCMVVAPTDRWAPRLSDHWICHRRCH